MAISSYINTIDLSTLRSLSGRISSAVDKYEKSKDNVDEAESASAEIAKAAEELSLETQDPLRRVFLLSHYSTQVAILRAAVGAHLFEKFPKDSDITLEDLTKESNVDTALLVRILRVLSAMSYVRETGVHRYALTRHGKSLAVTRYQSILYMGFDFGFPVDAKLPQYLETTQFKNPNDSADAPFQFVYPGQEVFGYLGERPELMHHFHTTMAAAAEFNMYNMVDEAPWPTILGEVASNEVALVDLGGADGSVLKQIVRKFPGLTGEFILHDLPEVIETVKANLGERIKPIPHDFFTEEPIKGARAYHFRMIFHDWSLEDCARILRNVKPALKPGYSKLLITDAIVPDLGATLMHTTLDIAMMKTAAQEKTESMFYELLESEGFIVKKVWRSVKGVDGMIEAELPEN